MILLQNKHSFRLIRHKEVATSPAITVISKEQDKNVNEDKRTFLKIASIAGAGLVASQFLPKKAEALIMGSTPASNVVGLKNSSNQRINPAKEDGNLATIKTDVDTLVNSAAGGYIRQDQNATIAKESGGNLDAIKTQLNKLTFDGSNNLMTTNGGDSNSGIVGLKDATETRVNPATDDALVYLRRMVKLMESQAAVDSGNRQRITLDSLGTGTAVTTTVPVSGTVTANIGSGSIAAGTNVIGGVTIDGQGRQMFTEIARQAYNSGIRGNLIFS